MIDITKNYQTRDGREVRIYSMNGGKPYPLHGAIKESCGWVIHTWNIDGTYVSTRDSRDLVEIIPPKYFNIYETSLHDSEAEALKIGCLNANYIETLEYKPKDTP